MKDLSALFDLPNSVFMVHGELLTPRESEPMTPREIRKPDSAPRQAIARILMRAAMLHTDLLTSSSRDDLLHSTGLPPGTTIRVDDAESRSVADLGLYWSCGRTAMDLAAPTPPNGTLVRDWYLATAEYLLTEHDYAAGVPHLEHARSVLSGEARIALYLGAAYENLAAPPVQAAYQNGASALVIGSRPTLLRKAEFQLRSALLLEPDTTDASLRLGRTLLLMARPSEALPLLARAEAASLRAELKYYAALFSGFAHAELGHATEARAAFARASALFPDAQSPRLGLAQLAMLAANRDEALTSIQTITTGKPGSDPWWTYDRDVAWNVNDRMMAARIGILERLK
jgi:tetratricopeptide (TPR) repeat protein